MQADIYEHIHRSIMNNYFCISLLSSQYYVCVYSVTTFMLLYNYMGVCKSINIGIHEELLATENLLYDSRPSGTRAVD